MRNAKKSFLTISLAYTCVNGEFDEFWYTHTHTVNKMFYDWRSKHLPLSTFVIDIPRRGVRITRKHSDDLRNFIKLRLSPSLSPPRMAAAFRSISDDLHEDVDEFWESRRDSFLRQMQFRNIFFYFFFSLVTNFCSLTFLLLFDFEKYSTYLCY